MLTFTEDAALFEHSVDERGLPMIDMGDDRYVADIASSSHDSIVYHKKRSNARAFAVIRISGRTAADVFRRRLLHREVARR